MTSLLPINATALERAAEAFGVRATDIPVLVRALWNPETCPLNLLPWLAWAWSVDSWSDDWSESQKRDTVKQALAVQRIKGTVGAVRRALGALGLPVRVQEWFNQTPTGQPYTFRLLLDVDQGALTKVDLAKVLEVVANTKNLRSQLETVLLTVTSQAELSVAVVTTLGSDLSVSNYQPPRLVINESALPVYGTATV
ncbi:phage tail protein I [Pseudomonas citronellolis]|uniref:Phage tail protein I n=1 Tax=Pseudomonas citronellolis TaxID=53408 RepID=A0AAW6PA19_9PSED|nr:MULTISPECIES: phage tail protein I [Pseudomonas]KSW24442.1 phage tail protein [Pseudomonas sp. ADP]MDF3843372.1 phage tail protein I [Pseudomonas citronellolis]OBP07703.1 phage tail protein I [Pseudomonas sp. EGD-AKN5]QOF87002.1 phage tail protein I [Pseudomonas sp. ADPe]